MSDNNCNRPNEIMSKHQELCRELNMDKETEKISWKSFKDVTQNVNLEGDVNHWLCCAIYAACRESFTPTVGNTKTLVKGNCVSLTKLLRCCNISINEFFKKIKKWIELTNLSQNFSTQIERLERSFAVSLVLYQKYNETFEKLFINSSNERKNKKSRPCKCSSNKLYEFGWCLFLCCKGEEPKYTVDLVTSFHLLLCCIDLLFANAVLENRIDLINSEFIKLPIDYNKMKTFCIMDTLCKMHDASYIDAKHMKIYSWKTIIEKLIKHKTLQGNTENFSQIISNINFEPNLKSLNNTYEQYVLSVGEFDERMFFNNVFNYKKTNSNGDGDDKEKQSQINESIRTLDPGTPLTRRHHLPSKDVTEPVANATQNVKKLRSIAEKEISKDLLLKAGDTILEKLEQRLNSMENIFCEKYPTRREAKERFKLAKSLYYYLLDKIIRVELKTKPNVDLKVLLENEIFHITLIACCVELVIVAYNTSHIKFPWLLECFDLQAFHFYKIIEIVVSRHEDALTRSLIIHMNSIEEKCLDSLVWKSSSVLWETKKQWGDRCPLPSWTVVETKNTNNASTMSTAAAAVSTMTTSSSVIRGGMMVVGLNSSTKKCDTPNLERNLLQSPVNSAYDCFNQAGTSSTESARRDLFNVGKAVTEDNLSAECAKVSIDENERKPPVRAGSLMLFCRKFYKLAYMRISELCRELGMRNDEYLKIIWTLFEYSVASQTELMQDRHLDQMIMCAIYVFIKVKDIPNKTFADIMKFYRNQPQAASNIYREVLLEPAEPATEEKEAKPAKYGSIIEFYNSVYVKNMTPYALKFGDKTKSQSNLLLSPHPPERLISPKKIANYQLFITTLEKKEIPQSPNPITYEICRSPAKELKYINQIVRSGKRTLPFNDDDMNNGTDSTNHLSRNVKLICTKKVQVLIRDRKEREMRD